MMVWRMMMMCVCLCACVCVCGGLQSVRAPSALPDEVVVIVVYVLREVVSQPTAAERPPMCESE